MLTAFENFNAKVRIERPTETRDTRSGIVRSYRPVAFNVPALVVASNGSESRQYAGARSGRTGFAVFPFANDVRPQDRIVWGSRVLDVTGVLTVPHNEDGTVSALRVNWSEIDESPVTTNVTTSPNAPV